MWLKQLVTYCGHYYYRVLFFANAITMFHLYSKLVTCMFLVGIAKHTGNARKAKHELF
jgi:hypothetical protein